VGDSKRAKRRDFSIHVASLGSGICKSSGRQGRVGGRKCHADFRSFRVKIDTLLVPGGMSLPMMAFSLLLRSSGDSVHLGLLIFLDEHTLFRHQPSDSERQAPGALCRA
jgi:hypothetical protein